MNYTLPPQTFIGTVELTIRNLDRSVAFYNHTIGLELLSRNHRKATLGTKNGSLLILDELPEAQKIAKTTGLYHFAILVPDRLSLAQALERIIQDQVVVQGFADHGVSEAIYLPDLDGNGIEIYRDRPRSKWPFENGQLQMATDSLDIEDLISELNDPNNARTALPAGTTIGHMHLHVRDIPESVNFYRDTLGFDLKQRYGHSAAFLAAGDYHHHIGINTWAGVGALPSPETAIGLRSFDVILPSRRELESLGNHILKSGLQIERIDHGFSVRDPSGNLLKFMATDNVL